MPFNDKNNGFQNETAFVKKLHYKIYKDIDFSLQLFLEDIFGKIVNTALVECYKNHSLQKYDIIIKIGTKEKYVSIKKGVKNSTHTEPISEFIHFLIENKMPKNLIISFLKYHYADGTTNGTGKVRMSVADYKVHHENEISQINQFLNHETFLIKAIDRFVLKGNNSRRYVDAIIYGVPEDFFMDKKERCLQNYNIKKRLFFYINSFWKFNLSTRK